MKSPLRILITSGATREPIDQVRYITNFSTGRTGAELAQYFARDHHEVFLLAGEGAVVPEAECCEVVRFGSFHDLNDKMRALLAEKQWDLVVHLAAVGDFSVSAIRTGAGDSLSLGSAKIDSCGDLTLELKRNFKIVSRLGEYAQTGGSSPLLVAFKLTNQAGDSERTAAVGRLLNESPDVDLVIHNDLSELRSGVRVFRAFSKSGFLSEVSGVNALANALAERVGEVAV